MSPTLRRPPVLLIVVAVAVVVIGFQALLYQRDTAAEKQAQADRSKADQAYAVCLTRWGNALTDALRKLQTANKAVDAAEERKDKALDRLIELSNRAQQLGAETQADLPPAFIKEYETTLSERVDAQNDFDTLKTRLEQTREANPYVAPQVRCAR